ncbi:hypothetical protein GobsT_24900 [Gemmata obscuriglobus]|uniref:Uncharacterized protein n=1 Tax=Gemmata obscuriglobus TaxID=114 RepID=A0A2Z3H6F9_9BACT|nr:hypothetical protein [Gemmata obscuriglobus]AWM39217.1 hypothetical protein C1280_21005 [Gemmata obscuriglobus]QEG27730.1 hypothetical protein GobsT_24900 [Gemmata obscuriglobus]VTS04986.1 unnamed protein product [Gemmata obscuriglobus UQM 2246]
MEVYAVITIEYLTCLGFVLVMLRTVRRDRAACEARLREADAAARRDVVEARAELSRLRASLPPELVLKLELSDDEPAPDLPAAFEHAKPLVFSLSAQEQSLGGGGLVLTAAKVEFGSVRLTLSPVDRVGAAERVRQLAEAWNANARQLPPGVISAWAAVVAA